MNDIIEQYKIEQYNYFSSLGYIFYILKPVSFTAILKPFIIASIDKPNIKNFFIDKDNINIEDLKNSISSIHNAISIPAIESEKFFINFFYNNPNYRKIILNHSSSLVPKLNIVDYYVEIIKQNKSFNIKELINFFNQSFSKTQWKALTLPLDKFQELLLKKFSKNETHQFWVNFLKLRKNQIDKPEVSFKIRTFLMKEFGDSPEKIKKYCSFFQHLKSHIEYIEPDIFELDNKYTILISINFKKISKIFNISNYKMSEYEKAIESFMEGVTDFYKLDYCYLQTESKKLKISNIIFYHSNENLSTDYCKNILIEWLMYLQKNYNLTHDINIFSKWLLYKSLNDNISPKKYIYIKPNKI